MHECCSAHLCHALFLEILVCAAGEIQQLCKQRINLFSLHEQTATQAQTGTRGECQGGYNVCTCMRHRDASNQMKQAATYQHTC